MNQILIVLINGHFENVFIPRRSGALEVTVVELNTPDDTGPAISVTSSAELPSYYETPEEMGISLYLDAGGDAEAVPALKFRRSEVRRTTMTNSHTPEPWSVWRLAPDSDPEERSIIVAGPDGEAEVTGVVYSDADARRIVECVNALAGIDDPAKFVADAKALKSRTDPGGDAQ